MRIQNIILTNYRLYKGVNRISFSKDENGRNIYLISGENGFGKTSFLQSLLWCLYGRLMAEIDDTIKKEVANNGGYYAYLIRNLNNSARQYVESVGQTTLARIKKSGYSVEDTDVEENSIYSVQIDFSDVSIPSIHCRSLSVKRSYDFVRSSEEVEVMIDNQPNELAKFIGNDVFINDFILNKDIARFFFFDSERIVSLAETNTIEERRRLSSAYNEVLGVKKYEDLKHNLEALRLKFRKRTNDIEARNKLGSLLESLDTKNDKLSAITSQIEVLDNELVSLRQADNDLQERLLRQGQGMTIDDFKRQQALIEQLRKTDAENKNKLRDFLDLAPFAIVGELLVKTYKQVQTDYNTLRTAHNIQNQNALLESIQQELDKELLAIDSEENIIQLVKSVLSHYHEEGQQTEPLLPVTKEDYQDFVSVFANLTSTYKVEFSHLTDDNKKVKQQLSRVQQKISNMRANESDEIIKDIRKQKDDIEESIRQNEEQKRQLLLEQGSLSQQIATIQKQISELSKRVSLDDSDVKKDTLSEQLIFELDEFLRKLKSDKKELLEHRIKTIMNSLMHKEDFIADVAVNLIDDGLDIDLYDTKGRIIHKDSLSKGEQQLYATSLLKALVDESGMDFPVFIDSPLQKFDKSHSQKIITEFYPTISKQVVLFPLLHKELSEAELNQMKPLVKSAFIIRNETDHSSFQEVDINTLMTK